MTVLRLMAIGALIAVAILAGAALRLLPRGYGRVAREKAAMLLCRLCCRLLRIRVAFEGAPPPASPTLLVANHVSWTDVLALGGLTPMRFLARHDLADWPALGPLARVYGALFVERGRLRQIPRVNAEMAACMRAGDAVVLFAEATTGDGTRLKRFHAVHFAAARDLLRATPALDGVVIAPAALAYTRRRGLPLGRAGRADVAWYGDTEFAPHLLDLIRSGGVECRISFLEPFVYDRDSDRKAAARRAGGAIRAEVARLVSGIAAAPQTSRVVSLGRSV